MAGLVKSRTVEDPALEDGAVFEHLGLKDDLDQLVRALQVYVRQVDHKAALTRSPVPFGPIDVDIVYAHRIDAGDLRRRVDFDAVEADVRVEQRRQ